MKKLLLSAIMLMGAVWSYCASAQKNGWDIEAGVTYSVLDRAIVQTLDGKFVKNANIIESHGTSTYGFNDRTVSYSNTPVIFPTVYVNVGRHLDNLPVSVRLGLYVNHAFNVLEGGPSVLTENETIFHLMPEARFYYLERSNVRLLASFGAGLRTRVFTETLDGDTVGSSHFGVSWQIVPIGMEIGTKWYFTFSFGTGYSWEIGRASCRERV